MRCVRALIAQVLVVQLEARVRQGKKKKAPPALMRTEIHQFPVPREAVGKHAGPQAPPCRTKYLPTPPDQDTPPGRRGDTTKIMLYIHITIYEVSI